MYKIIAFIVIAAVIIVLLKYLMEYWWVLAIIGAVIIVFRLIKSKLEDDASSQPIPDSKPFYLRMNEADSNSKPNAEYSYFNSIHTKVVGVSKNNNAGTPIQSILPRLTKSAALKLVREPNNHVDRNAIMVYANGKHIGYVSADIARRYAKDIDKGTIKMSARIKNLTGGNGLYYGCNIVIDIFN